MSEPFLNYHHLRLFWEVARAGSLRMAAARLHLSQPTISTQIKALEQSLDEKLFDRAGRGMKLTPKGKVIMDYASEIFTLGSEMLRSLHGEIGNRPMRLNVGITDSLPKLLAWRLIRPAIQAIPNLHLCCVEGHAQELLGSLAGGRLDMVLSDEAAPSTLPVKAFNHLLGTTPVIFCAAPALAKSLEANFPASLRGAPMLLPSGRTAWRHEIDRWFDSRGTRPHVIAEFDDAALMKIAASDGLGVAPIAAPMLDEAIKRYSLRPVGTPVKCGFPCYLITLERVMRHPALAAITMRAKETFDAGEAMSRPAKRPKPNPGSALQKSVPTGKP
ncbi:MAG: LysR family transcriptional regulator [Verrucomicrobiales bacterium VVV1]|nr:MAG: LysR family transcriptional regulator [Verrucomicrobiales bacterium VVV1]